MCLKNQPINQPTNQPKKQNTNKQKKKTKRKKVKFYEGAFHLKEVSEHQLK